HSRSRSAGSMKARPIFAMQAAPSGIGSLDKGGPDLGNNTNPNQNPVNRDSNGNQDPNRKQPPSQGQQGRERQQSRQGQQRQQGHKGQQRQARQTDQPGPRQSQDVEGGGMQNPRNPSPDVVND